MIGALMVIISLLFLFYMGSSLVSSTKKILGADTRDRDHLYRHRRIKNKQPKGRITRGKFVFLPEEKNRPYGRKRIEPGKTVSSKYLFRRPWLTVRCEDMLLPNGNHIPEYYILEYPDWVNTIAITKDGKFVFVRQYRPGIERTCYELCAGVCEKEDASPLVSAQRELWEETGYGKGTGRNIW